MNCPYCQKPIETHEPGEHLDRLMAEKVMKWEKVIYGSGTKENFWRIKKTLDIPFKNYKPSTDISQAMEGVEKVKWISIIKTPHKPIWSCEIRTWKDLEPVLSLFIPAETAPLAITRALVMWAMESQK